MITLHAVEEHERLRKSQVEECVPGLAEEIGLLHQLIHGASLPHPFLVEVLDQGVNVLIPQRIALLRMDVLVLTVTQHALGIQRTDELFHLHLCHDDILHAADLLHVCFIRRDHLVNGRRQTIQERRQLTIPELHTPAARQRVVADDVLGSADGLIVAGIHVRSEAHHDTP